MVKVDIALERQNLVNPAWRKSTCLHRQYLTVAAMVSLLASLLVLAGGCSRATKRSAQQGPVEQKQDKSTESIPMKERIREAFDRYPRAAYLHCNSDKAAELTKRLKITSGQMADRLKFILSLIHI